MNQSVFRDAERLCHLDLLLSCITVADPIMLPMFAVFKRKPKRVAMFLPVAGTDVETVVRTARKITHYGRYGRLSFKDGINTGKGVGEISGSPLVVDLGDNP